MAVEIYYFGTFLLSGVDMVRVRLIRRKGEHVLCILLLVLFTLIEVNI